MRTFADMPFGYRWMTSEEIADYNAAESHRWGWMRDEYVGIVTTCLAPSGQPIVKWDCMIEFGMDHDHDSVECERLMAEMGDPFDGFDFSDQFNETDEFGTNERWVD